MLDRLIGLIGLLIAVVSLVGQYRWHTAPKWITDIGLIIGGVLLGIVIAPTVWLPEPAATAHVAVNARTSLIMAWLWAGVGATGGALVVILGLSFWPVLGASKVSKAKGDPVTREELASFFNAWVKPAALELNNTIRVLADHLIVLNRNRLELNIVSLVYSAHIDTERAALAVATNLLSDKDATGAAMQDAFGDYYRRYYACRTWIAELVDISSFDLSGNANTERWLPLDESFLHELRQLCGSPRFERLRKHIDGVGWGETITRRLRSPRRPS